MYNKGKYIVGELASSIGMPVVSAVCFNEVVSHDSFKQLFTEIYSAGFFHVQNDKIVVYGKSVSLNVESNEERDTKQIARALGMAHLYESQY